MAWVNLSTRIANNDYNSAADVNQMMEDIRLIKGGTASVTPSKSLEDISAIVFRKRYIVGQTYNSVVLSIADSSFTLSKVSGWYAPFQDSDGAWLMDLALALEYGSAVAGSTVTLNGISIGTIGDTRGYQTLHASVTRPGAWPPVSLCISDYSAQMIITSTYLDTVQDVHIAGRLLLASKPTFIA